MPTPCSPTRAPRRATRGVARDIALHRAPRARRRRRRRQRRRARPRRAARRGACAGARGWRAGVIVFPRARKLLRRHAVRASGRGSTQRAEAVAAAAAEVVVAKRARWRRRPRGAEVAAAVRCPQLRRPPLCASETARERSGKVAHSLPRSARDPEPIQNGECRAARLPPTRRAACLLGVDPAGRFEKNKHFT